MVVALNADEIVPRRYLCNGGSVDIRVRLKGPSWDCVGRGADDDDDDDEGGSGGDAFVKSEEKSTWLVRIFFTSSYL